ncbi:MAG: radical SAM protein, partial [Deltaproteobacteria bacterium]|nr:radical SAM protein [Deltaproteobacteria bacterium]
MHSLEQRTKTILARAENREEIAAGDLAHLLRLPLQSDETYAVMACADAMSREDFGTKAERHMHIGLNAAPCPHNCKFCSLTEEAGAFTGSVEFPDAQVLAWAREAEDMGADALNLMTTGDYPFSRLLEVGRMLSAEVDVPLVANTRDITHAEGEALLAAGFSGFYHAVRLGEGRDTPFPIPRRIKTIRAVRDVGLLWMTCVEPVGPEHAPEELADRMLLGRKYGAVYSGVMRRINFPGAPLSARGMISEREMARMVAVCRLAMGDSPRAHCVHEPS